PRVRAHLARAAAAGGHRDRRQRDSPRADRAGRRGCGNARHPCAARPARRRLESRLDHRARGRRPGHGSQARVTAYRPSPRPTFDAAAAIPYAAVTRHVWGDAESGEVADWIYASTDRVHALVFGLAAGAWFRHSPEFRTIFGADE